jgi:hypothetical protein
MRTSILALAAAPVLSGCLIADIAGAAVGATVVTVGAVGGAVIDLVTTDEEERRAEEIERLRQENEALRRRQEEQANEKD